MNTGGEKKFKKILIQKKNEDYEKNLEKAVTNNNLTLDDVKKKRKMEDDKYTYINQEKEEGDDEIDPTRLKAISGRKLWKIRHKFALKKRNKRMEKRGIFNA